MKRPIKAALVFGATSAIATAYCRILASRGAVLHLVGRDHDALQNLAGDLDLRGATKVSVAVADLCDTEQHKKLVTEGWESLGEPDLALLAHATLGSQSEGETDWKQQRTLIQTNLISPLSLLTLLANRFEQQHSGCLAAISSVAGDRGRPSNYIYGATKAGLSCYLGGLQHRLAATGVRVLDLRLGPVDTPMTAGLSKGLLWSTPERVAHAMDGKLARHHGTVYLPAYWRPIMGVVRVLPDILVQRLGI